ncbi:MAG: GNAT family N-acetyltransferase [Alphaproteobacteria bacterium]
MGSTDASPRAISPEDADALVPLSAEAGWNQTADDWRTILAAGAGEAIVGDDGRPVASACAVPLTRRSDWICMVLVTAAARRRGHATRLMARQIDRIRAAGRVPGLDATELGRPVYLQLGFVDRFTLGRFRAAAPRWPDVAAGADIRPMTRDDLTAAAAYDEAATGSARRFLLDHLLARLPAAAWIARAGGRPVGFAMGRDGRRAPQIGPVVADDPAVAAALLSKAGRAIGGPSVVDARDGSAAFVRALEQAGFVRERGFTRMSLGHDPALDRTAALHAVAGPEFG